MSPTQVASDSHALIEKPSFAVVPKPDGRAGAIAPASGDAVPREVRIREIAYRLYEARGCVDGHDVEDWLAAEASVDVACTMPPEGKADGAAPH